MPTVWKLHDPKCPKDAIYIGRPSSWGNPFTHLKTQSLAQIQVIDRAAAVECFRILLLGDISDLFGIADGSERHTNLLFAQQTWMLAHLEELRGHDLSCWCAPLACHGDILIREANK